MSITFSFQNSSIKVHQVNLDGTPWFKGKDVAGCLGYSNTEQAVKGHVQNDDKRLLCEVCSRVLTANKKYNLH